MFERLNQEQYSTLMQHRDTQRSHRLLLEFVQGHSLLVVESKRLPYPNRVSPNESTSEGESLNLSCLSYPQAPQFRCSKPAV